MSIFPSYLATKEDNYRISINELPEAINLNIDFNTGDLIIENGDFVIVKKDDAIKVWCYFALKIAKGRYLMFNNNYGNEFEDKLIGNNYYSDVNNDVKRMVNDCLLQSQYIKSVDEIEYNFDGDTLNLDITITTIYSEGVEING